jgi:hypothetical protein
MKQFKNTFSVSAKSRALLLAFQKDLFDREFKRLGEDSFEDRKVNTLIINRLNGHVQTAINERVGNHLELENSYGKALELAAELKEEEFKVGDWVYWSGSNKGVYKITDKCRAFSDSWQVNNDPQTSMCETNLRKATDSEIESYLLKEAEKKGFVKGAEVVHECSPYTIKGYILIHKDYLGSGSTQRYFNKKGIHLAIDSGPFTFPVDECTLLPSDPQIVIAGKSVEFKDDDVIIHGKGVAKRFWVEQNDIIENMKERGIKIKGVLASTCSGEEFLVTTNQIEEIANHFQSK